MKTIFILLCAVTLLLNSCTKKQSAKEYSGVKADTSQLNKTPVEISDTIMERPFISKETTDSLLQIYSPQELRKKIKFHEDRFNEIMGFYDSLLLQLTQKENRLSELLDSLMKDSTENKILLSNMFWISGEIHRLLGNSDMTDLEIDFIYHEGITSCFVLFTTCEPLDTIYSLDYIPKFMYSSMNASQLRERREIIRNETNRIDSEMNKKLEMVPVRKDHEKSKGKQA